MKCSILVQFSKKFILPFSKMLWRSRRSFLGVLLVLLLSPIVFFIMDRAKVIIQDLTATNRLVQRRLVEEYVEQETGRGCKMPQLNPFDEDMASFIENLPFATCEGTDWVKCYKSECSVTKPILKTVKDIICIYRDIIYVDERKFYIGPPTKVVGKEKFVLNNSDHVKIDCAGKDVKSPNVRALWSGYQTGFRPVPTEQVPPNRKDSFNVMILCFDSASRNGFIRKMQNSYKYLTEKLNAVILNSYNIVGDGTTAALYPILTGKPEEEHIYSGKRASRKRFVDSKKFIFHMLKEYGYRTAYFEDVPWMGTPQYKFNWFRSQPADHYLRALLLANMSQSERSDQDGVARHCFGATPQYQLMMNLADEFLQLDGKKFCFTLIVDMASENFTVLPTADESLLSFLQTLSARRALEDTLIVIMGDHGSRFSSIRATSQGKLEERLPLMAILLPEKLKTRRPTALSSLRNNIDVLTTPFDIYATILDVLDLKEKSITYNIPGSELPRAMSLLKPIPKSRSCGEAGVMPHWCACAQWSDVPRSSLMYEQVAKVLAEYIDSISDEQRSKCAKRRLISIEWVQRQNATDHLSKVNYFGIKELTHLYQHPYSKALKTLDEYYQAKITMSPGNSVFEGTMIYNRASDYFMITQRDISRVSAYGDEPKCISATHPHLNKYCYCKDKLSNTNINNTIIAK